MAVVVTHATQATGSAAGDGSGGFADSGIRYDEFGQAVAEGFAAAAAVGEYVYPADSSALATGAASAVGYAMGPVDTLASASAQGNASAIGSSNYAAGSATGVSGGAAHGEARVFATATLDAPTFGYAAADGVRVKTESGSAVAGANGEVLAVSEYVVFSPGVGNTNIVSETFDTNAFQLDAFGRGTQNGIAYGDAYAFAYTNGSAAGTSSANAVFLAFDGGIAEGYGDASAEGTTVIGAVGEAAGIGTVGAVADLGTDGIVEALGVGDAEAVGESTAESVASSSTIAQALGDSGIIEVIGEAEGLGEAVAIPLLEGVAVATGYSGVDRGPGVQGSALLTADGAAAGQGDAAAEGESAVVIYFDAIAAASTVGVANAEPPNSTGVGSASSRGIFVYGTDAQGTGLVEITGAVAGSGEALAKAA